MHAFSTCMGSLLGHQWAQKLIKQVQDLITSIRASHRPKALLEQIAKRMGINRMLITSNKTCFTSVHASIESVLRLQPALQELARQHPDCLSKQLFDCISDDMFFIMIKQLCKILEAFTLVNQAVQAACATLADNHTVLAVFGKGQYYSCPFSSSSMQAGQARPGSMLCRWEEHFRR